MLGRGFAFVGGVVALAVGAAPAVGAIAAAHEGVPRCCFVWLPFPAEVFLLRYRAAVS